jgi:Cu/Ag efflux protein CusF
VRLWRAVVLVNLALALGLLLGYLAWGRPLVRAQQQLARQPAAGIEQTWTVEGVVRAIFPDRNMVVLTHGDIPGYMVPMTMGFQVRDPRLYEGLDIGDIVRVTLRGIPPDLVITAISREGKS